jgi:hypothetical protein
VKWQQATRLLVASAALMSPALAAPPVPASAAPDLDADFLEFLGSVDAEEAGWSEFLERSELEKVVKQPSDNAPAKKPAADRVPAKQPPGRTPPQAQSAPPQGQSASTDK